MIVVLSVHALSVFYVHVILCSLKYRMQSPPCFDCCTLDLRDHKVLEAAPAFRVRTNGEVAWSVEWAGIHLGGWGLPQACTAKEIGPPAKPP